MKVYFDKKIIQKEYLSFLAPLLWCPDFDIRWEDKKQIKERYNEGQKLLSSASKESCDYFVYPKYFLLNDFKELKKYSDEAKTYNKKVLVFSYGEIDDYINIDNNIIRFKRSTKRKNPDNEFCLPPFPEDFLPYNNNSITLIKEQKDKKYSIGYTWYSDYYNLSSFLYYISVRIIWIVFRRKYLKRLLMKLNNERIYGRLVNAGIGNYCRGKTIKYIKKLKKYEFDFIQRGHALTTYTKDKMREQYIQNLIKSDFVLLVRWFWNYSIRQYEVLSLGKIPIYIDTWAKLPFQDKIPYDELFIRVPIKKVHNIGKYIDSYIRKNQWNLTKIQKKIRDIYEEYFVMKNYYSKIIDLLQKK